MEDKIRVLSIFGTRPEAVKMAPLIHELQNDCAIQSLVCITAQHRQMLDQVMDIFSLDADYDLDIMKERQTLTEITTRVLEGLSQVIDSASPDIILVHGDTTTSFVASLAAFYKQIPVGHVEAGLRTFNKYEPFPEEMNRKLTGTIATLHFSPTSGAKENLLAENVDSNEIFVTGNTVIDALKTTIQEDYIFTDKNLNSLDYINNKVITITAHRRENLGEPLKDICSAINEIVQHNSDVEVVYAVHMNPSVREVVYEMLGNNDKIHLVEPLDIKDMHNLLKKSYLVLTDSGGLQEEVPSLGKPVLVLRNVTERPEGVEAGTLKLVGTNKDDIVREANLLLTNKDEYEKMAQARNPFGDGRASARIVDAIKYHFNLVDNPPEEFV
ncbi:MAG: UDP-N-acetylglucosamine 2-epimerase [Epulopiscium sp. Nele67-Bin004]|nr:MAG: UDP-N-acetylglucosamine 2-epimerase [Epulopiscium sp. Nele67-Bin004]